MPGIRRTKKIEKNRQKTEERKERRGSQRGGRTTNKVFQYI